MGESVMGTCVASCHKKNNRWQWLGGTEVLDVHWILEECVQRAQDYRNEKGSIHPECDTRSRSLTSPC